MDLKTFFENFETIAEAPSGIDKLRSLILDLAVRGKLVSQQSDNQSESISNLFSKVDFERNRYLQERNIKEKNLNEVETSEYYSDLPNGWKYARLGRISFFLNGYAFKSKDYISHSEYQLIRLGNVKNDRILLDQKPAYIPKEIADENEKSLIQDNDLLITMTGTKNKHDFCFTVVVNRPYLNKKKLYLNQRVGCIRTYAPISARLISIFLKSTLIVDFLHSTATGTANQANIWSNNT